MKSTCIKTLVLCLLPAGMALISGGCDKKSAGPPPARPPSEVSIITVSAEKVELISEYPGRINPVREAQVRARATGILLKREFEEGANIKEGDLLFQIDPAPLQAVLDGAKAALAKAEASLQESQANVNRYEPLVKINAISRQVYDQAVATLGQDQADVLSSRAAVETAQLNLGYTRVEAPISGRIGKALVTEGALVSATDATQLALIRQLDPVYFDFTQSSTEVLRLRRALENGSLKRSPSGEARVTLVLEDGTVYQHEGKLLFSDVSVDPTTGMITLRAEFPNPENVLLPGMFARARIVEGVNANAITVPERTVTRGAAGIASVLLVNAQDKVEPRVIDIDRTVGTKVVVSSGLNPGDRVIVEGSQKAPPGAVVKVVPFVEAGSTNAPAAGK